MWLSLKLTSFVSLVIGLIVYHPTGASGVSCPDGWTRYGFSCYLYVSDKQTWQSAEVSCQTLGGHLVRIQDKKENANVLSFVNKHGKDSSPWLGMSNMSGKFRLIYSPKPAPYLNFKPGEPNNHGGSERCVQFWGPVPGKWNDNVCSKHFSFVCEI